MKMLHQNSVEVDPKDQPKGLECQLEDTLVLEAAEVEVRRFPRLQLKAGLSRSQVRWRLPVLPEKSCLLLAMCWPVAPTAWYPRLLAFFFHSQECAVRDVSDNMCPNSEDNSGS